MDLRQLHYVVAIADQGSFTRAARALHVAQPSLSNGVRRLESELGVELFSRLGRGVQVTAAGERVIQAARRVLRDLADLDAAAASVTLLQSGTLDVVTLPTLSVDPLATLIGTFRLDHPGVLVRMHEPETVADVEADVRSGKAELGFTDLTTGGTGLARVELFRQEIVVVSPPGSSSSTLGPHDLAELSLIVTPVGTSTRRLLDRTLSRSGREPSIAVELHHREAIVPLVLAGAGSSMLPARLAHEAAARGAVIRHLRPAVTRRIGILHRCSRLTPAATTLIELARATLRG